MKRNLAGGCCMEFIDIYDDLGQKVAEVME